MKLDSIAHRFRVDKPKKFKLSKHDTADCLRLSIDKADAQRCSPAASSG